MREQRVFTVGFAIKEVSNVARIYAVNAGFVCPPFERAMRRLISSVFRRECAGSDAVISRSGSCRTLIPSRRRAPCQSRNRFDQLV